MTIAEKVRMTITDSGMKQKAVAEKAGWDPKKFSDLVSGRRTFLADYLPAICFALNKTPEELLSYRETEGEPDDGTAEEESEV